MLYLLICMHHKNNFLCTSLGLGCDSGAFLCFFWPLLESPGNGIHLPFFFWLALSLLCRKKKTGRFLFPLFFPLFLFLLLGENSTTIASERYTIFFFESLLTTLMLFNCFFCGCRYGNNENNVLIGGFSTGWFYVAHVMSSVALRSVLSDFLSRRCSVCSYVRT
jgi:hypothetical protein